MKSKHLLCLSAALVLHGTASFATANGPACEQLTKLVVQPNGGPIFLVSFPDVVSGPLTGVAFTYDNALATIALIACGETDRAARIGDALLAAQKHDRFWHDGRIRNAYLAGVPSDVPLKLPGWWDNGQNMWVEDQYQVGSDTGNQSWAMLALLALYRAGAGVQYLKGAQQIGSYLERYSDAHPPGGFIGGAFGDEPTPVINTWKSTEHNSDLDAAFEQLADATGDEHWRAQAAEAKKFVNTMWTPTCACFAVGTATDGETINPHLALDAQVLPLLALPASGSRIEPVLQTIDRRLKQGSGYSYSEVKEGIWTEGTAQVALLLSLSGRENAAHVLLTSIEDNRAPDGSYYAANLSQIPTGFMLQTDPAQPLEYFHLSHLAALSWIALAQERLNPFNGTHALR